MVAIILGILVVIEFFIIVSIFSEREQSESRLAYWKGEYERIANKHWEVVEAFADYGVSVEKIDSPKYKVVKLKK